MKRELPILFNTDMVCSALDNLKTATRRIVKQSVWENFVCEGGKAIYYLDKKTDSMKSPLYKAPYQVGDILYVRETWNCLPIPEPLRGTERTYWYKADGEEQGDKWRPSIHMPKAAARIWLHVTGVMVESLQDMTLDDFLSEGVVLRPEAFNDPDNAYWQARDIFRNIWNSTIPKVKLPEYGWDANPWVWVINFERCKKPAAGKEKE